MNLSKILFVIILAGMSFSCKENKTRDKATSGKEVAFSPIEHSKEQLTLQLIDAEKANRIPRTIDVDGNMHWANKGFDWTEGFFPGSCWYLYEFTKDEKWKTAAEKFQALFEDHKNFTTYHDLGFVFNCSYGNGYRLTKNEVFKEVMITAGDSLMTRFDPTVGCIKSWDVDKGWQSERNWMFPVIIDNMMNLEMLFELTELTGNKKYKEAAITHASTTLKNHFRDDNSSYHVVDYNPETGEVRSKQTAQGFEHESAWARGQAWGLYGYTVCYRYTKDSKYLEQAQKIADFIVSYKTLPEDGIPYWDYNAPKIPNEPRDVSAAAITVSALIELDAYSDVEYRSIIDKILSSLASDEYTNKTGENKNFILKHSVGSIPHGAEIDVPLNYADYYYLEALTRYQKSYAN
ncbi:glycoside hydrolase family 88 protein [Maribacter sp. HTCC2170]|uniref:glycoside hydrolase family 88 protein n=1 Tax=Maribacter sp. (strain HTCC2170 / KCCM 42371) TaxID=313603 RepID=UPI00006BD293|nr:glycoside hydrolase family 88 protein [Maribacter sp. HTCC2170]EAR02857.1 putative unsaturated glucuronyl hydrolase [Maribacter sp. HTCC2170]